MANDQQKTIVLQFNECINNQDLHGLAMLMTEDHIFIDSTNHSVHGKEPMLQAWQGFFASFPDYRNVFERVETRDSLVVILGHSTCSEKLLDGPALWTAQCRAEKIAEWRVYKDTLDNRKLLRLS